MSWILPSLVLEGGWVDGMFFLKFIRKWNDGELAGPTWFINSLCHNMPKVFLSQLRALNSVQLRALDSVLLSNVELHVCH
jgi:hypothetical protein